MTDEGPVAGRVCVTCGTRLPDTSVRKLHRETHHTSYCEGCLARICSGEGEIICDQCGQSKVAKSHFPGNGNSKTGYGYICTVCTIGFRAAPPSRISAPSTPSLRETRARAEIARPQPVSVTRQPRQPRPSVTGEPSESLKLFFFSDWRIQSLDLTEQILRSVAPVDVIVYGGDDVSRFVPHVEIPFRGRVLGPDDTFEDDGLGDLVLAIAEQLGCELPLDLPRIFL